MRGRLYHCHILNMRGRLAAQRETPCLQEDRASAGWFAVLLSLFVTATHAQEWPTRPVTLVVPFAAGGPVDTAARIMAARLSENLGQQVIVENVSGAGSMMGGNRVAKAAPDGYTFLHGNRSTHIYSQILSKKPMYDAVAEFAPVAAFVENSAVLLVRKDFPAATLGEFSAQLRANGASCNSPRRAPARPRMWCASCSTTPSASRSRTFPIAARRRRCRT